MWPFKPKPFSSQEIEKLKNLKYLSEADHKIFWSICQWESNSASLRVHIKNILEEANLLEATLQVLAKITAIEYLAGEAKKVVETQEIKAEICQEAGRLIALEPQLDSFLENLCSKIPTESWPSLLSKLPPDSAKVIAELLRKKK